MILTARWAGFTMNKSTNTECLQRPSYGCCIHTSTQCRLRWKQESGSVGGGSLNGVCTSRGQCQWSPEHPRPGRCPFVPHPPIHPPSCGGRIEAQRDAALNREGVTPPLSPLSQRRLLPACVKSIFHRRNTRMPSREARVHEGHWRRGVLSLPQPFETYNPCGNLLWFWKRPPSTQPWQRPGVTPLSATSFSVRGALEGGAESMHCVGVVVSRQITVLSGFHGHPSVPCYSGRELTAPALHCSLPGLGRREDGPLTGHQDCRNSVPRAARVLLGSGSSGRRACRGRANCARKPPTRVHARDTWTYALRPCPGAGVDSSVQEPGDRH